MPGGQPALEVLILAAGRGERLGLGVKAFLQLGGLTLLERAIASCQVLGSPLFVAVPPGHLRDAEALCPPGTVIIEGGATRSATLRHLLGRSSAPLVLVHDVVHPFASSELFRAVTAAVHETGAAIASLQPSDFVYRTADRTDHRPGVVAERVEDAWIAQSPKAFRREILEEGYRLLDARGAGGATGDADLRWSDPGSLELVSLAGGRVVTVPGDVRNMKITTSDDLLHAESLLSGSVGGLGSGP